MNAELILLRFGELTLKGKNRHRFETRVLTQIRAALKPFINLKFSRTYGRLYIELNGEPYEEVCVELKKIFGIASFSPVLKTDLDLQSIRDTALNAMRQLKSTPISFKVSARRPYKNFPYDSQQLNGLVGGYILQHIGGLKVNVHHPELELRVEIREEGAFIYGEVVQGLGGLPLGSSGKAMLMLSGGIDSPVAGWLSMRRGLKIEAVHFYSFPFTSERARDKVIDLTYQLTTYARAIRLHLVPFTEIQTKLNEHGQHNLMITLMRRAMFRITEKLASRQEAAAIITGESLGQVASQTLSSIHVINQVVQIPVLRPLIMKDKHEIIKLARAIDTYQISIRPYEDCCTLFLSKSPSTNPSLNVVERIESRLSWLPAAIEEAANHTETMMIIHGESKDPQKNRLNELF